MKTYLYLIFLISITTFAQNKQNAHWIFGDEAEMNFNTTPVSSITTLPPDFEFNCEEGSATVSDQNGNLLFFTEGKKVWQLWNGNYVLITSSLLGNHSSAQNAVIIPRPGHPNNYYIATIDGATGSKKGLYYSEIDLSGGLAQMNFLNIPLKDSFGTLVNTTYQNFSETITSTVHSDGSQYWLVCFINNPLTTNVHELNSYLVTANGININPSFTQNITGNLSTESYRHLKISPNTQKIALGSDTGVFLGTFNNSSGSIAISNSSIGNSSTFGIFCYGIEFSPDSNVLYYNKSNQYQLCAISVNSPGIENLIATAPFPGIGGMQLAIDGKIYCSSFNGPIAVINNPNNLIGPAFEQFAIPLNVANSGSVALPQWVHWQNMDCIDIVNLTSPNDDVANSNSDNRQATYTINAANIINPNAVAVYHAGESVTFDPPFEAKAGSSVHAYIEGCTNQYQSRQNNSLTKNNLKINDDQSIQLEKIKLIEDKINISPNPTKTSATISTTNATFSSILVSSIDGKLIFSQSIKNQNTYQLDLSNYQKGIYLISIETTDGKVLREKIIKD